MTTEKRPYREAIADLLVAIDRSRAREASAWVVVVIDTEPKADWQENVSSVYGPFDSPEEALVQAGTFDADEHTGTNPTDGSPGWAHVVVPLFDPPK